MCTVIRACAQCAPQRARRQRVELVEQRRDEHRVDGERRQLHAEHERPERKRQPGPRVQQDPGDARDQRRYEHQRQRGLRAGRGTARMRTRCCAAACMHCALRPRTRSAWHRSGHVARKHACAGRPCQLKVCVRPPKTARALRSCPGSTCLSWSVKNSRGVCLLKPCRCSTTKTSHRLHGMPSSWSLSVSSRKKATDTCARRAAAQPRGRLAPALGRSH